MGGGGWEAGGRLYLAIELFGVATYESKKRLRQDCMEGLKRRLWSYQNRSEYQTHTSHLVPSMGPIVSVVTLHGWQNQL